MYVRPKVNYYLMSMMKVYYICGTNNKKNNSIFKAEVLSFWDLLAKTKNSLTEL